VVRVGEGEAGLSARTIKRRLATVAGLYEYLIIRDDVGVTSNPVPRAAWCTPRPPSTGTGAPSGRPTLTG